MTRNIKGYCIIVNNSYFDQRCFEEPIEDRYGSHTDVSDLERLFESLDFKVIKKEELTKEDLLKELTEVAKNPDLDKHEAFVISLNSHGCNDQILCYDGQLIHINDIINIFNADNCRFLIDKPKIVLFNACRVIKPNCKYNLLRFFSK